MLIDNDFKQVGKRLPYNVSPELFSDITANVMDKIGKASVEEKPLHNNSRKKISIIARLFLATAASIAIILAINWDLRHSAKNDITDLENAFCQLSSDDQEFLLDVDQQDIFLYQ